MRQITKIEIADFLRNHREELGFTLRKGVDVFARANEIGELLKDRFRTGIENSLNDTLINFFNTQLAQHIVQSNGDEYPEPQRIYEAFERYAKELLGIKDEVPSVDAPSLADVAPEIAARVNTLRLTAEKQ